MTTIQLPQRVGRARQAGERGTRSASLHLPRTTPVPMPGRVRHAEPVLLLSAHPGALSLISTFVAISGHDPLLPHDDESIEQAVLRVRPRVSIVDFEHPGAASPRIEQHLLRSGSRVIVFSTWYRSLEARARAVSMRALFFALPIEHRAFDDLLQTALLV
ncbi:MAG TPA: hypothetical protein VIQ60_04535 [Gemmatimonadaceae bacterium]